MRLSWSALIIAVISLGCLADASDSPTSASDAAREADELLRALDAAEPISMETVLALEALRQGNTRCAICLLESALDFDIAYGEVLLSESPSPAMKETVEDSLTILRAYRSDYPRDPDACPRGVCSAKP